jgi:hypothetical protein
MPRYTEQSWIDILQQRGFSNNSAALAIVDLKLLLTELGQNSFIAGSSVLAITELSRRRNFTDIDLYGFLVNENIERNVVSYEPLYHTYHIFFAMQMVRR